MNFTREPIIETIITPKEGYKLVLRNSKASGQEEFFVDAVEVISFGHACFYRSLEKPKCFLVPVGDYEILEVRETRVVLKTPGIEKGGIKIGGGKESSYKLPRDSKEAEEGIISERGFDEPVANEQREDKKRERRRLRKKRGKSEQEVEHEEEGAEALEATFQEAGEIEEEQPKAAEPSPKHREERATLIPPPPTLISETLAKYKDTPGFAGAFFEKKEEALEEKEEEATHNILLEEVDELEFLAKKNEDGSSEEDDDSFR